MMNYSILIMSCDRYSGLLDLFFGYFSRFYDTSNTKVYLSLESGSYETDKTELTVLNDPEASGWSHRLKNCLMRIDTKAVLILLDDFMIESAVDTAEIEKLSRLIEDDDSIAHFALTTVPMQNESGDIYFDRYYKRQRLGRYKTTLQAGLWNREELMSLLSENESPWEVEVFANMRSFLSPRNYYAIAESRLKPIDYNDGAFCLQGKINEHEVARLSEKFGEAIDVSGIGIPSNDGIVVRDATPFLKRIKCRLRMICCYVKYRFLYCRVKAHEKQI